MSRQKSLNDLAVLQERLLHHHIEFAVAFPVNVSEQGVPHARGPELLDVLRQVHRGLGTIGHGFEEATDLVGHADEVIRLHREVS